MLEFEHHIPVSTCQSKLISSKHHHKNKYFLTHRSNSEQAQDFCKSNTKHKNSTN